MIQHKSPISGVAAYNNQYVATAGYDNQLILWDATNHTVVNRSLHDHLANQTSFSRDGKYLVSSSSDHTARLWSVPDMKLRAVLSEHNDDVEMSVFHPSLELIATASRDHCLRVYDFHGQLQFTLTGHTADVISVAWSVTGDELISSSDDGTVKRWSMADKRLVDDIDLAGVETDTIAIASDGTIFAGNDDGEIVVIRDNSTKNHAAHAAGVKRLVYQPEKELLVSLSYDRTVRIWSTKNLGLESVASAVIPPEVWARSCAFINDSMLAFATFGSTYAVYHIDSNTWDLSRVLPTPGINAVAVQNGKRLTIGDSGILSVDGKQTVQLGSLCNFLTPVCGRVVTGGQTGQVMDALTGDLLMQHHSPLNCGVAFKRDGTDHVVIGAYSGEGLVLSFTPDGSFRHEHTLPLHSNAVKDLAYSDEVIFSVCADGSAAWFSSDTFAQLGRVSIAHDRIANGCAALPGGQFASVSRDHKLRIWKEYQAEVLSTPHSHSIKCVATSHDGRYVATGSYSGLVAIYDLLSHTWSIVARPTAAGISSLCYDMDAGSFLAGSYDGKIYMVHPEAE